MERIVLGYDGSPASVAALHWTAARAARRAVVVDVVNVLSPLAPDRSVGLLQLADADAFLRERAPGLDVGLHRLEGQMPGTLSDFARDADLVVIGISTGHPVRAALAGFMPLRLTINSSAPVVLVPAHWVETNDPVTAGVASDSSSDAAIRFAADEAGSTGASLRLVHAWLMPTPSMEGSAVVVHTPEAVIARHQEVLDAAAETVRARHPLVPVHTDLVRDSRSAALMRFAPTSSLLVVGTHRLGPFAGGLLGSVAQEILWRAECPVCVVPQ